MQYDFALFKLGFRPFFLGAAGFAAVSAAQWMAVYLFWVPLPLTGLSGLQWHAHEMIYGYSVAVITGFLLTAAKNWTGVQTLRGIPLVALFGLWAAARILFFWGTRYLHVAVVFDLLFAVSMCLAVAYPIVRARQWRQLLVLFIVGALAVGNLHFYLGYFGYRVGGVNEGIYAGLYLVIALVLVMSRRVIPFFIERGVGYGVRLFNSKWIDFTSAASLVGFVSAEVLIGEGDYSGYLALCLCVLYSVRLVGWHTRGIWRAPLLWSLYASVWIIVIAFLLFALSVFTDSVPKLIAVHAFSYGGVGMVTMAMMARVSLGHTGRDLRHPPRALNYCFTLLLVGTAFRVGAPLIVPQHYTVWVATSQLFWIAAFALFVVIYAPVLIKRRVDGRPG